MVIAFALTFSNSRREEVGAKCTKDGIVFSNFNKLCKS